MARSSYTGAPKKKSLDDYKSRMQNEKLNMVTHKSSDATGKEIQPPRKKAKTSANPEIADIKKEIKKKVTKIQKSEEMADRDIDIVASKNCGACQNQKRTTNGENVALVVNTKMHGHKKNEELMRRKWLPAKESIEADKQAIKDIKKLYDNKKIDQQTYIAGRNEIAHSIVMAEQLMSSKFSQIKDKFKFKYIEEDPEAERLFSEYESDGFPMFVKNSCKSVPKKDGGLSKKHCRSVGSRGPEGLITLFDTTNGGMDISDSYGEIERGIDAISSKYADNPELLEGINEEKSRVSKSIILSNLLKERDGIAMSINRIKRNKTAGDSGEIKMVESNINAMLSKVDNTINNASANKDGIFAENMKIIKDGLEKQLSSVKSLKSKK